MVYENLIYEKEGGIAKITINRPEVMNAISQALLSEIKTALEEAGKDDEVGVVVLTGEGRAFSAGVDLKSLGDRRLDGGRVGPILDDPARDVINTIQAIPKVAVSTVTLGS